MQQSNDDRNATSLVAQQRTSPADSGHQVYSHWKFPFDPKLSVPMKGTGNGGDEA